jgi:hypothetical protein
MNTNSTCTTSKPSNTPATLLRIAYATHLLPDILDAARKRFGPDVEIAGTPNADPSGPLATWPYPATEYVVVGRASAHRTGPTFTVVRRVTYKGQ